MLPLSLAFIACTWLEEPLPPRPASFQTPRVDETGATPAIQLWRTSARYVLPDTNRPPDYDSSARFELVFKEDTKNAKRPDLKVWKAKLPFDVGDEARRFAPKGMTVLDGSEEIPYSSKPTGQSRGKTWRIKGKFIVLTWPSDDLPSGVAVSWTQLEELIARHELAASGLEESEFVQYTVSLGQRTRQGLLLNAPGSGEWDISLPEKGATFDTWMALEPAPVLTSSSDGAEAILSVIDDAGNEREVGRRRLSGPSEEFVHWRVSLSRWAGQQVTLKLRTQPGANNHFDYLFFGSPTVWGPAEGEPRRVIVIGLDTTRPDHMGIYGADKDLTPAWDAVARQSVVFDSAWMTSS